MAEQHPDQTNIEVARHGKTYTIGAFAQITGTTERTLRFYDRKGLLKPGGRNAQGHRYYQEEDLIRLQQILTLKFLDFPLGEIGEHLDGSGRNLAGTLDLQRGMLLQKREQLDKMIGVLDRMRALLDGAGRIDSSLLLFFMHCIQNEESQ
ncbi:MAG: MarR family transcriptional regulator, partial [Paenibacillus sp.]|nr:MarR family transcriptional regulator [Paenibacillus sp.]